MKKILFPILALILIACSPQVTATSEVTITLTPTIIPTQTPEPPSPAFLDLQEEIAKSDMYTLTPNGIEMENADGTVTIVPDIKPSKTDGILDGKLIITYEGQDYITNLVSINEKVITTKEENGTRWIFDGENIQKEIRKFVPANTIEFTENLSNYDLFLAPDADKKGIYEDALVNNLIFAISPSLLENRAVFEKVVEENPEWKDIGPGSDYKERLAFMQAFLKASGGRMTIQNRIFEKFEADLNLPIKFEVIQVNEFPKGYSRYIANIDKSGPGGGGSVYVDENGQYVYSIAILPGAIERTQTEPQSLYKAWNWTPAEVISDLFRQTISEAIYRDRHSDILKYQLYTKGGVPKSGSYYADVYWTFIKSK